MSRAPRWTQEDFDRASKASKASHAAQRKRDTLPYMATGKPTTKVQTLWIAGVMPSLNEIIADAKVRSGNYSRYADTKRQWERNIAVFAGRCELKPVTRAHFRFEWREQSKRRDPDNVSSAGRKLILDSLVACGVIPGDGWAHVAGWEDAFTLDKDAPGIEVTITPVAAEAT